MYSNILPYNSHRDNSHIQGHNKSSDRSRLNRIHRVSLYPLTRSFLANARSALRRDHE